jgi:hypothetical protein
MQRDSELADMCNIETDCYSPRCRRYRRPRRFNPWLPLGAAIGIVILLIWLALSISAREDEVSLITPALYWEQPTDM